MHIHYYFENTCADELKVTRLILDEISVNRTDEPGPNGYTEFQGDIYPDEVRTAADAMVLVAFYNDVPIHRLGEFRDLVTEFLERYKK